MVSIYLIHFFDGMMHTASDLQPGIFQAAKEGELDIIDITDPTIPRFYVDGVWREIDWVHKTEMKSSLPSQLIVEANASNPAN